MSITTCIEVNQLERAILASLYMQKRTFESLSRHTYYDGGIVNFLSCMEQMENRGFITSIAEGEPEWSRAGHRFFKLMGKGYDTRYFKLTELGLKLYLREIGRVEDLREATK